jgi:hypothetical protein
MAFKKSGNERICFCAPGTGRKRFRDASYAEYAVRDIAQELFTRGHLETARDFFCITRAYEKDCLRTPFFAQVKRQYSGRPILVEMLPEEGLYRRFGDKVYFQK